MTATEMERTNMTPAGWEAAQAVPARKPRVLIVSGVVPDTSSGARLALYRHFILRDDFEIAVASLHGDQSKASKNFTLRNGPLWGKLHRSRFDRLAFNTDYFRNWHNLPPGLETFAREFRPDVIFNVPDNIHPGWAWQLSRRLGVPLAVDFQDLTPLSRFEGRWCQPFPFVARWLMSRYHFLNRKAEVVFYTSEGMRDFFGGHANGSVLYPLGDSSRAGRPIEPGQPPTGRVTLVYAGNCYGPYGRLLRRLAHLLKNDPAIALKIYPVGRDWPEAEIRELEAAGVLQRFKPFNELLADLEKADAFLSVMSFEKPEEPFVKTSFTTKWLDYVPLGKPVFVWGPDYSTAATFAREYGCGVVVDRDDPALVREAIVNLQRNPAGWREVAEKVCQVARTTLNSESIHRNFLEIMQRVCQPGAAKP